MPALGKPLVIVTGLVYLGVVLAIGWWSWRRTRTARDFFIAGQRVGLLVTGIATMSAAFSGFVFLGGPGLTYRIGVTSLLIVAPVGFTSALLCWVVGKRLRLLSEVLEIYTIPDAIACRYRSRPATVLAAACVAIGSVGYLGAQFLAVGVLIQSVFGVERLAVAMGIGVAVVVLYSTAGGMVAGVYTDLFQGVLMVIAAVLVFERAIGAAGGWTTMIGAIDSSSGFGPRFLDPLGAAGAHTAFGFFFVFGIGVLGQPQMLHKFYMLDDPRKMKWMPLVLGASQAMCLLVWLGIGLAVPALVAQGRLAPLSGPDEAAPAFLLEFTPELLAGAVFAAVLAAIMSTADSFMNIGAAALVRDLPRAFGIRLADELRWGRIAGVAVALAAAAFAYAYGDLIALIGTFAFGTFAAGLAPALAVGLNWGRVTPPAAVASIATGSGLNLLLELLRRQAVIPSPLADGVLPAAAALAVSFGVLFVVTWCTAPREPEPEVRAVIEC